jgi:predicted RNA-binding protein with PIN domain
VATQYLIVDGHSNIFSWPELRKFHARRTSLAREVLIKRLRQYQDWTGTRVAVVFDGSGSRATEQSDPHDLQIFYAARGQSADSIVERLASKYASRFEITVATSDSLEKETVNALGAACISPEELRRRLDEVEKR